MGTDGPNLDHKELRKLMNPDLPPGLVSHIDRVLTLVVEFSRIHDIDLERTLLSAQGHDLLRATAPEDLLARALESGIEINEAERTEPLLLHGPLGALELREKFGVHDQRVLHTIRWHTTGHPQYDTGAWLFFVADKVEPNKLRVWPELRHVLRLALKPDPDAPEKAALAYLDLNLERGSREGWTPHPMAILSHETLSESQNG